MQASTQRQGRGKTEGREIAARRVLAASRAILLDWDGCVALGNRPRPQALRFIAEHRDRVAIVSNNSTDLPEDFAAILAKAGAPVPVERIMLAGAEALAYAAHQGARKVMVLGDGRMKALGRNLGLNITRDTADLVVLLRDTRFSYARLQRAANALRNGAGLVAANPDMVHPGANGQLVPETGALLAALLACTRDVEISPHVVGKPSPWLFNRACDVLGVAHGDAVMIGDNPDTDIAGAQALGLSTILIDPGAGVDFADLTA